MLLERFLADVRHSSAWLLRSPVFSLVAIASLAIGIGVNTAIFSLVDALLLRPLPIERADQIVDVYTRRAGDDAYETSSYPDLLDFRAENQVFAGILGYSPAIAALKTGDQSRVAVGEVVTGNYFQLLGVGAVIGRTLLPEDDTLGARRVIAISHRTWMRDYGGDSSIVGRDLSLGGQAYTVVGVIEQSFHGLVPMLQPDMWLPVAWVDEVEPAGIQVVVPSPTGETRLERRGDRWLFLKARLKDGETGASAEANLHVIMSRLGAAYPETNARRTVVIASNVRIHPEADRSMGMIGAGLMLAVGLVLLVACANVANMLLARASGRQKEIGIRLAIGASRRQLVQQLLTEGMVLSILGAAAGMLAAMFFLRLAETLPLPVSVPVAFSFQIDARVVVFTMIISTAAGLLAGLAPALKATTPNLALELKGDRPAMSAGNRRWTLRDGLVMAQTAVTLVLLVSAGLLTRNILEARKTDLGFRPSGLAVLGTEVGLIGYNENQADTFHERALERIRSLPGIQSAARTVRQPLAVNRNFNGIFFPDRMPPGANPIPIAATWIDDNYFSTLGVPLVHGRNVSRTDTMGTPRVAVVNDAFVRTYWPGEDVVGKRFRLRTSDGPEYQIVGIVADYKVDTVGEHPTPYIHYPLSQGSFARQVILARTQGNAAALLTTMRRELLAMEPDIVFLDSHAMDAQVNLSLLPARLAAQMASLVAFVATLLAAIGLYGVIAYSVTRRTREIGVRIALGAARGSVVRMVMRQGLTVAVAGLVVGAGLAYIAATALAGVLYGVSAFDPLAWGLAATSLLGAAVLANFVPARRASRVDPLTALRTD